MEQRRKWRVEYQDGRESDLPMKLEPLGYCRGITAEKTSTSAATKQENMLALKKKRAMEIGQGPLKSVVQTGIMMWMSGKQINIFSIMITGMLVMNTLKSMFGLSAAFQSVEDGVVDLLPAKLVYLAGNLVNVGLALWKLSTMGLLPLTSADWTWLLPIRQALETSAMAIST